MFDVLLSLLGPSGGLGCCPAWIAPKIENTETTIQHTLNQKIITSTIVAPGRNNNVPTIENGVAIKSSDKTGL